VRCSETPANSFLELVDDGFLAESAAAKQSLEQLPGIIVSSIEIARIAK
jgi:hypothetical protein